ncbi:trafficking protein particle complex subunit 10 isoform X2 [Physeter macrocephalus]|uniref:Trafficking protein particle complex subunit 10 isoform X2 n=1 Tax=Physeter macrocephalus TaxID=9755 RepID=A0A9W2WTD5_PHYMC|nr:trafficking protein particle complex subunit 10 isoform X2 [Physeter catodon]
MEVWPGRRLRRGPDPAGDLRPPRGRPPTSSGPTSYLSLLEATSDLGDALPVVRLQLDSARGAGRPGRRARPEGAPLFAPSGRRLCSWPCAGRSFLAGTASSRRTVPSGPAEGLPALGCERGRSLRAVVVFGAGDQNLFTSIYPTLSQQLPREPMEWRRSYGRAPKMIHLESNFVQFKEELLPKEGNKALLTFPFLHIYWTECCDTEVYKATVKDDLTKWQNVLKAHSSVDWLIVVVENDAKKKNKTNILPRTSIVDKIRNDFCNKQSDRCVVLSDPLKDSSRTQESWNAFLTKLRTLLLMSFTKNLGKFEDDMRTLREKRTEPGWSFCDYFMVQEELAFVFEMLQQFEDALVQYDELDALFSQYVVNFGAGDGANWLTFFCQPVKSWNGLILRKPIDMEKRGLIQRQEATLLDLRSYLFSRQCTLLLFLQRPWEVAQRALELLHSCVQELKLLEVSVPPGALDCWVFLSCLEVLQRIEGCCDRAQIDSNIAHTVGLWSYATGKLKSLGYLCGLVSEQGPNSEDLNRTVDLLAGLGAERPETANTAQSPYKKLKEALSSVEAFEKHYLDLSHATIEMYTSIGRIRSAKFVGKDLAEFYMRKKSPQKAEIYLQGALKNYLAEGWALPITHTRKQLAECQKHLGQIENYLQTSSVLASDRHLTESEREHFCREVVGVARRQAGSPGHKIVLPMHSFAQLRDLHFTPSNAVVHVGGVLSVEITVCSQMPVPVHVEQIAINVHFSIEKNNYRKTAEWLTKHKTANGIVSFPAESSPFPTSQNSLPALELCEMFERSPSDNSLHTTGIICKNVHMLLRKQESGASLEAPSGAALEAGAHVLKCAAVTLEPGPNTITFRTQAKEPGTYTLRQLCASVGPVWFVLPHIYPLVQYDVYSQEPQLHVEPLADSLLAGIPQKVKFTVTTGHYAVKNGDSLQLSNVEAVLILCHEENRAVIYSNMRAPATGGEGTMLGVTEPRGKPKDTQKAGHCMATTDHQVSIDCPWSIYSTVISLTFSMPFRTTHSLLSSGTRKYVQVCVQNLSELDFQLSDSHLVDTGDSTGLRLIPLNTESEQRIHSKQAVFFVWELKWTQAPPPCLHCRFSVGFSPASEERLSVSLKPYTYEFQVDNFLTLYNVRAEISPPPGTELCKTGSLCSLEVSITRLSDLSEVDKDEALTECDECFSTKLMYEVVDNSSNWAVCGKSSGVISMPVAARATHRVHMEVMPLFAGYLPLPDVRLFKYLPHHSAHSSQLDADSWIENDSLSVDKHVDDQVDSGSVQSRGSVRSVASSDHKGLPMPRLRALPPGQAFNASAGTQVLVVPSQDDHVLEVSVT